MNQTLPILLSLADAAKELCQSTSGRKITVTTLRKEIRRGRLAPVVAQQLEERWRKHHVPVFVSLAPGSSPGQHLCLGSSTIWRFGLPEPIL